MADRVNEIFSQVLRVPAASISDATSPDNTPEWDSLAAMNLVIAIEDEFDVRLSSKEILAMQSVQIVKRVLRGKGVTNI